MIRLKQIKISLFFLCFCTFLNAQDDAVYKITIDADPLIKQINGRELPGDAQVRIVITGRDGEVIGGKIANGIIPNITIDEEPNIGKVLGVELTLNGIGWTKSVTVRNVKVRKVIDYETKTYDFPCGCPLTQGNQSVYMDAGGALDFEVDAETIRAEEMADFEIDGEFESGDVIAKNFTISKRNTGKKVNAKGAPKVQKTKTRICTTQEYSASASFDTNFLTNPTQNSIYPGALIYAEDLADGSYNNIKSGKDRAPVIISTSSAVFGSTRREVDNPSLSAIREATNDIMINQETGKQDVQVNFEIFEVSSKEELSIAVNGYFENASATVNASFNYDTNSEKTLKVVKFAQIYYTMDVDPPSSPEDVFTNPKDAIEVMNSGKTPLYVSSVTMGRIAYFFMETKLSSRDIKAHLDGEYRGAFTAGGSLDLANSVNNQETKISALIIGGDGSGGIEAVRGYDGFINMIEASGEKDPTSLGVPVSYALRFLSDNSIARTNLSTSYTKRTCKEVVNPIVEARFKAISLTSSGNLGFHGSYQVYLYDRKKNTTKVIASGNLWDKNNPKKMEKDKAISIDKTSRPFELDGRKIDDYDIWVDLSGTEAFTDIFSDNDSNSTRKILLLKDVLSLDKAAPPKSDDPTTAAEQSSSMSLTIDGLDYKFKFNMTLL